MAINFPNSPTVGQQWPSPPVAGQPVYTWDGQKWSTQSLQAKQPVYVDGSAPMQAQLTLVGDPVNPTDAADKHYVDAHAVLRSYLAGLTLSTAGSSATFSVAAGVAADSTNVMKMTLSAALSKTTSAWIAGNGGALDTGTIANNTWYHVHLIMNPTTLAVDVLISLSPTAPTLPGGYTLFRRIGSMKTNASGQWTLFHQLGDEFLWDVSVGEINTTTLGTTATLFPLSGVPSGIQVWAQMRFSLASSTAGVYGLVSSPDESVQAVNVPVGNFNLGFVQLAGYGTAYQLSIRTSNGQIRAVSSAASTSLFGATNGWIDRRGRDA